MYPKSSLALLGAGLLALCAGSASAQPAFITGTVVDSLGVPQFGININVENNGSGGNPNVFNDGTDINGFFFTTVDPQGLYDVVFLPQPPNLITRLTNVNIFGTVDLGTVVLDAGVTISGRLIDPNGLPVAGVNFDVIDKASGNQVVLKGDKSDALGMFSFAVPSGPIELRLDTTPVPFPVLAPTTMDLDLSVDTNFGDITLPAGLKITTVVLDANGAPVTNTDTDTIDLLTKTKLFTPTDNTDGFGLVSVVVPAGTYEFRVCAKPATGLVDLAINPLVVAADVNLGLTVLPFGIQLSGTVTDSNGQPLAGIDIDVEDSTTLVKQLTCFDNTDGSGQYLVIVPAGTWNVRFTPDTNKPYATSEQFNIVMNGNTVVNGSVPDCPFSIPYGTGVPGTGGIVPVLTTSGGTPTLGNNGYTVEMQSGLGGGVAPILVGFAPGSFPFKGGTLLINLAAAPFLLFTLPLSGPAGVPGAGSFSIPAPVPLDPVFVGASIYLQFFVQDTGAPNPSGLSFSNGLQITYCQ